MIQDQVLREEEFDLRVGIKKINWKKVNRFLIQLPTIGSVKKSVDNELTKKSSEQSIAGECSSFFLFASTFYAVYPLLASLEFVVCSKKWAGLVESEKVLISRGWEN